MGYLQPAETRAPEEVVNLHGLTQHQPKDQEAEYRGRARVHLRAGRVGFPTVLVWNQPVQE